MSRELPVSSGYERLNPPANGAICYRELSRQWMKGNKALMMLTSTSTVPGTVPLGDPIVVVVVTDPVYYRYEVSHVFLSATQ